MPMYNVPIWVQVEAKNEDEAIELVESMGADELEGGNVGDATLIE